MKMLELIFSYRGKATPRTALHTTIIIEKQSRPNMYTYIIHRQDNLQLQ